MTMNKLTNRNWILIVIVMVVASSSVVISFFVLFDPIAFEGTRVDFLSLNTRLDNVAAGLIQLEAKLAEETPLPAPIMTSAEASHSEDKAYLTEIQPETQDVVREAVLPKNPRLVLDEEVSRGFQAIRNPNMRPVHVEYSTAFVLLAHDRVDYIKRTMEGVLRARNVDRYTIYVSVDSNDNEPSVRSAVLSVPNPNNIPIAFLSSELPFARDVRYQGEPSIPRHMASVFNHIFRSSLHEYIIILEDDLDVSVDFFDYFASVGPLLHPQNPASKGLFCVSAWNDHGFGNLELDPTALIRTDWYPGLGVLFHKSAWIGNLENEWPIWDSVEWGYDHWLRYRSTIIRSKDCIAPEVPRTHHFAQRGLHVGGSQARIYDRMILASGEVGISSHAVDFINDPMGVRAHFLKLIRDSTEVQLEDLEPSKMDSFRFKNVVHYFENNGDLRGPALATKICRRFQIYPDEFRMKFRGLLSFKVKETATIVTIVAKSMRDYWLDN